MRFRLIFFLFIASLVLTAQTDTTTNVLLAVGDYDHRINLLENSFNKLLIFNIVVNIFLFAACIYVVAGEFDLWAKMRVWLGSNSKSSIRDGNGRASPPNSNL